MKKVVSIILLICVVCLSYTAYAAEEKTEKVSANIKFETIKSENKITIKIYTGKFVGIKEGSVMSASMTLSYDSANVTKVSGKTTDNWKITISDETKRVLLENDSANSNTQFAEITFELKKDVEKETNGIVSITDFNISDGNLLDENYSTYSANYTIKPKEDNENNNNEAQNEITNETTNEIANEITNETNTEKTNTEAENMVNNVKDNTISTDSKLPQTGVNAFILALIVGIIAFAIINLVKYKDIEIK